MNQNLRERATELRRLGLSYQQINGKLGVPKSTLSYWLKDLPLSQEVKEINSEISKQRSARNITRFNKLRARRCETERQNARDRASAIIGKMTNRELCLVGAALYWAEGYKKSNWNLVFCNSDPKMVRLMMKFFRDICSVPEEKLRPQVQVHENVPARKSTLYWSKIVGLPVSCFSKPIKQKPSSSKNRRGNTLPYGTFRLRINDVHLVNQIMGWIEGLKNGIN